MDDINNILNDLKKSALNNLFTDDFDSAIDNLKKAEIIDRENPEILFNLGIAYCRKGLFKTSHDYFLKVLNLQISYINTALVKKNIAFCMIKNENYNELYSQNKTIYSEYYSALNNYPEYLIKYDKVKSDLLDARTIFE